MELNDHHLFRRIRQYLNEHRLLVLVLSIAIVVWYWVFLLAAMDFIDGGSRPYRAVWNGYGSFDLFGFTINYSFEGYLDYDYYYYNWGQQFLKGFMPYTDAFDHSEINGFIYNTPYFFPPLFVYMCTLGSVLPIDPFGIGFLITLFGFLTAFPIYGISLYLSQNLRVAVIAAATYLFNPVVLYYTVFEWLNPAPFVFFMMLSFYLLMRGNRIAGTLAMVTSALFKQTAFFLAIPLIAYLLKRAPVTEPEDPEDGKRPPGDELDLKGFVKIILVVLVFVVAFSLPYIFDIRNYIYYILERPGGFLLNDLTDFPNASQPITFAVLLIAIGAPEPLIQIVNIATYYSIMLVIAIIPILALMLLQVKDDRNLQGYWRRILFLTLLLMLCIHLFSPRGIYKYYCVALIPFFSIQPVSQMISLKTERAKVSLFMILIPLILGFLILIPNRNVYLAFLLLTLVGYIAFNHFGLVHGLFKEQISHLRRNLSVIGSKELEFEDSDIDQNE
ncbi:hypothetical protein EU527_00495 [Candidatus Thorarchaeota archaeon]|nr:MAG: hypothetical protein EU527_00495 [Candidatus Thorarchaeota archaeon]